ncbi:hypothetical protein ASE09_30775 [Streptomyces sp. Root66D1]|nr:hypothetical protein ASD33_21560 [Streptomyces sp. Root1304]KRA94840.1 hypothetical protein ASE09_30775 [Streptomyces sp. Root66D1]
MSRSDIWVDFGLSGLAKWLSSPAASGLEQREVVGEAVEWGEGAYASTLLSDAERLLASSLTTEAVNVLWSAAVRRAYAEGAPWLDGRAWLREIVGLVTERYDVAELSALRGDGGPDVGPALRAAVLAEIEAMAAPLAAATESDRAGAVRGVVPVLRRVVTEVDPDLGFRFFLRALKAYGVPITESRYLRYHELGERLGYHELVVDDGSLQVEGEGEGEASPASREA